MRLTMFFALLSGLVPYVLAEDSGYTVERVNITVGDAEAQRLCASGWPSGKMLCLSHRYNVVCRGGKEKETAVRGGICIADGLGHEDYIGNFAGGLDNPGYVLHKPNGEVLDDPPSAEAIKASEAQASASSKSVADLVASIMKPLNDQISAGWAALSSATASTTSFTSTPVPVPSQTPSPSQTSVLKFRRAGL